MPFYEYQCPKGHVTEILRSIERRTEPTYCHECDLAGEYPVKAEFILSPTPTTFVCAGGRKL